MRSIRQLLSVVATDPSRLEEVVSSLAANILDMDVDNTFSLCYELQDVLDVAAEMNVSVNDEQAFRVLTYLVDNYNPVVGLDAPMFREAVNKVLSEAV